MPAAPFWIQWVNAFAVAAASAATIALTFITRTYVRHTKRMVEEMTADRQDRKSQLVGRVKSNLERIQRLSELVRGHQSDIPFSADVGDELEVIWNTYYSVADPIFILRGEDLP